MIKTKYKINQQVYVINDNKIVKGSIYRIYTETTENDTYVRYDVNISNGRTTRDESDVYSSKVSIINSIIE